VTPRQAGRYFRRHQGDVVLGYGQVEAGELRKAQLGAAWALSAHGTVSSEPALIVLPTGVGKTLLVCLAPFLLRSRRALVVTPGRLVRAQVATAFETLEDLKRASVLPREIPRPSVVKVEHRATNADWSRWRAADVVVGTPNVLSDGYPDVQRIPEGLFDLLIFDEAHHLPARVWTAILHAVDAPALLLTATPTRRDGKPLDGDLIYTYPLSQAISDGVYAPVRFVPVELPDGADPDRALAAASAERLAAPEHREAGSRLLVRTGTQAEARYLVGVYAEAGLRVGVVLADTAPGTVRRILDQVRGGALHGFVAVGAMIEGFDFPTLKVAAYHHPHRSLAPTIQFLGRLSRAVPQGLRGELLAIPEQVDGETRELYRDDRDWAELMPEIVDAAQREERTIRRYMAGANVSGPLDLAARALTPPKSARIFRLPDDVTPTLNVEPERIGRAEVVFRFFDAATDVVAFVTRQLAAQRWAQTPLLEVPEFELHLATWIDAQRVLFVSTESRPALGDLLEYFGVAGSVRNLAPDDLVRLVYAADPGSYFSVGLRAAHARRAQGASYDMTAGPAVEGALDYNARSNAILGHLMARPRRGNRGTLGFSVAKSKLWEPDNAESLLEFRRWAVERAGELDNPAAGISLPRLDVRLGEPFDEFPAEVLSAAVDHLWLTGELRMRFDGSWVEADELDVLARREDAESVEVTLTVRDAAVWRGFQRTDGSLLEIEDLGVEVLVAEDGELIDASSALRDAPLMLYLADGSTVFGEVLLPPRHTPGRLPNDMLLSDPWEHVDRTRELGATGSVQARTAELAASGAMWAATDHGSGELADFISLTTSADAVSLRLYHCKGAGGPQPSRRVGDLYEVVGQAIKCVPWTLVPASLWQELSRRLDHRAAFRLIHGDPDTFRELLSNLVGAPPHRIAIDVIAVQPGVSISDVQEWSFGRALLHAAAGWCAAENTHFRLLGSP
jgi:superfamily II DNA or RNA helicase